MEHILTETRLILTPQGNVSIRYELLAQKADGGITLYGAAITNEMTGEQEQIMKITSDERRALEFFERISRGLVTPVTFIDVAEDFVAES